MHFNHTVSWIVLKVASLSRLTHKGKPRAIPITIAIGQTPAQCITTCVVARRRKCIVQRRPVTGCKKNSLKLYIHSQSHAWQKCVSYHIVRVFPVSATRCTTICLSIHICNVGHHASMCPVNSIAVSPFPLSVGTLFNLGLFTRSPRASFA